MIKAQDEVRHFVINSEESVITATYNAKNIAAALGFNTVMQAMFATSISELATNIIKYAKKGHIIIGVVHLKSQVGLEAIAEDQGPGIIDRAAALADNFSTGGTLGVGLPGVKRMMDEFYFDSSQEYGTKIMIRKWKPL